MKLDNFWMSFCWHSTLYTHLQHLNTCVGLSSMNCIWTLLCHARALNSYNSIAFRAGMSLVKAFDLHKYGVSASSMCHLSPVQIVGSIIIKELMFSICSSGKQFLNLQCPSASPSKFILDMMFENHALTSYSFGVIVSTDHLDIDSGSLITLCFTQTIDYVAAKTLLLLTLFDSDHSAPLALIGWMSLQGFLKGNHEPGLFLTEIIQPPFWSST